MAVTQGRATEAKGREVTAKRAREGDSISTSAEHDRGAPGRMGVTAVATARGIDNRPAWMTEGQGMKRARELEEAGAATEVTQGRVDDELEGIRQAIRGNRPSKVGYDKRRDRMAATMATTGMEHEVVATNVTTAGANGTLAGGAGATSEANAGDISDAAAGPTRKKGKRKCKKRKKGGQGERGHRERRTDEGGP